MVTQLQASITTTSYNIQITLLVLHEEGCEVHCTLSPGRQPGCTSPTTRAALAILRARPQWYWSMMHMPSKAGKTAARMLDQW